MPLWLPSVAPGVRLVRLERKLVLRPQRERVGSALSGGLDAALAAARSLTMLVVPRTRESRAGHATVFAPEMNDLQ